MFDDGTNGDLVASDGIFSCYLPFLNTGSTVKFYIRGKNADAIKLSPERAEYEYYTYSPVTNSTNSQANNDKKLICVSDALGRS